MSDELPAVPLSWHWEWVPETSGTQYQVWTDHMVALFAGWTSEGLAAARLAWAKDTGSEFPFTPGMVGREAAEWLLDRAGQLPAWSRLAWGAAFVDGRPRWAPVPVVAEFRRPQANDPNYLMEVVGASGRDNDARPPVVDYVTTPIGDGVRVFALARTPDGAAVGRVDAALRLDVPPHGSSTSVSVDVLLTTLVVEMPLMALIGTGVEQLMQQVANDCAPASGPARLAFTGERQQP